MTTEYHFSYLPCEFCVGKNHCETCASEIAGLLTAHPGVLEAKVDRPAHTLALIHENINLSDLEDAMDAAGVFLS